MSRFFKPSPKVRAVDFSLTGGGRGCILDVSCESAFMEESRDGRVAMSQPTIFDVASRAGVSISTVSRVLNGSSYVDPEKRGRVLAAVEALGFSPRAAARALAGKGTRALGLLVPEISGDFFVPLLRGIESAARESDYELIIQTTRYRPLRSWSHGLGEHNTDGLLLFADSASRALLEKLSASGFPVVLLYTEAPDLGLPSVIVENERGAAEAVGHLISVHGRHRIVCLVGPEGNHDAEARFRGYKRALAEAAIPFDPALVAPGDFQADRAAASIRGLLARGVTFDAVFAGDDGAASGVLSALTEAGIGVGSEVSVVGFDDLPFVAHSIPPLATVRAPTEDVGVTAVRTLVECIEHRRRGDSGRPAPIVLPTVFVPRASCGCTEARLQKAGVHTRGIHTQGAAPRTSHAD
jgi:DNA-binding LacI/PurR family transcriptional regulator